MSSLDRVAWLLPFSVFLNKSRLHSRVIASGGPDWRPLAPPDHLQGQWSGSLFDRTFTRIARTARPADDERAAQRDHDPDVGRGRVPVDSSFIFNAEEGRGPRRYFVIVQQSGSCRPCGGWKFKRRTRRPLMRRQGCNWTSCAGSSAGIALIFGTPLSASRSAPKPIGS